jgi:DinB superfamily
LSSDTEQLNALCYPIGRFRPQATLSPEERSAALRTLHQLPQKLRAAVDDLSGEQLETPYREGGWTVRQLVHHLADSHLNAYARTRLALTEDWPTVKPYKEGLWAELADARSGPVAPSLELLGALHARWVMLFNSLEEQDWKRGYSHPENGKQTVEQVLALYDWHSRHHLAHVTGLRTRMHW